MKTRDRKTEPEPIITAEQFDAYDPLTQGMLVGLKGRDGGQPNIPEDFRPDPDDLAEFERGMEIAKRAPADRRS